MAPKVQGQGLLTQDHSLRSIAALSMASLALSLLWHSLLTSCFHAIDATPKATYSRPCSRLAALVPAAIACACSDVAYRPFDDDCASHPSTGGANSLYSLHSLYRPAWITSLNFLGMQSHSARPHNTRRRATANKAACSMLSTRVRQTF